MAQGTETFWLDIKKFEDMLTRDPNSYCFSQLSELYRKIGLLDDAIFTAKRGLEIHPDYVGGYLSLGRAFYDKGLKADCREALEHVVKMTPENIVAQKLLSQLYLEQNEPVLAEVALRVVLDLSPDDVECRLTLEALSRSKALNAAASVESDDEDLLEEAEIIEELMDDDLEEFLFGVTEASGEVAEEVSCSPDPGGVPVIDLAVTDLPMDVSGDELPWTVSPAEGATQESVVTEGELSSAGKDPLTTATLAEIYLAQGFYDQALGIYRELVTAEPGNSELHNRIAEIEALKSTSSVLGEIPAEPAHRVEAPAPEILPITETVVSAAAGRDGDERAVELLQQWLVQIRRVRACR